jgi:hypothetical protein
MPLTTLARFTSLVVLSIFVLVDISLFVIKGRKHKKDNKNLQVQVPRWVPLAGAIFSLGLIIFEVVRY